MEPISFLGGWNGTGTKVVAESPAMPMGNTYQIARPSLPSYDAVTISAEAQAAADLLRPAS